MELALADDATQRVVSFLRQRVDESCPFLLTPDEFIEKGYGDAETIAFKLGHHPEVIARLWNRLAEGLPDNACVLVFATPAVVNPASGRLLAFVSGMSYMVRVPARFREEARALGYRNEFRGCWPSEESNPPDFGPEWVAGKFKDVEAAWIRAGLDQ
jgi:hypothetical protein